jgi:beta-N-acetylhexosaminidase
MPRPPALRPAPGARRARRVAATLSATAGLVAGCAPALRPADAPAPTGAPPLPPVPTAGAFSRALTGPERAWVDRTLAALSPRDRVAQLVTVWVLGDYTNLADSSFVQVRRWIEREHVGGVVMSLGSPLEVAAKVNTMQRLALASGPRVPLLVSSDLEPGLGRFEGGVFTPQLWSAGSATVLPTNMAAGATGRPADGEALGRVLGREARAAGVHVDFAPTVDVNNNPANPVINVRSFGEDPRAVARYSAAFVRGLQGEGVAAVAKHFPGHGDTDADSHLALPVVRADRARLDAMELVPFRAALEAGVAGVMSAHIALPAIEAPGLPATLSPRVMTALLRDTLGFRGITFTDAMTMEGVGQGYPVDRSCPLAVQAGMDVLLMPTDVARCVDAVLASVAGGQITQARIDTAARRVLELKVRTGAVSRPIVDLEALRETVGAPAHWATARDVARRAVTLLRDSAALVPTGTGRSITAVIYAPDAEVAAGQAFTAELRTGAREVREHRISPRTSAGALDSIAVAARASDRIVVMTYTRTFEGAGRLAIPAHVARWIDDQAATGKLVVVAGGNPYVIRQFPRVTSYLVTYGRGDALERAAATALLGRAPITGRAPVSLPGFFAVGDGLQRGTAPGSAAGGR